MKASATACKALLLTGGLMLAAAAPSWGQATVDNAAATANQIATRLQGPGVTLSNADIPAANNSDGPDMYGLFSNGIAGAGLQINRGAALSTGNITEMFTSNNSRNSSLSPSGTQYNDADLLALDPNARFNVAVITMDITLGPYVTGFRLRYQFGSDEYPDYVGSTFNDLFAILFSGPGISGVENLARLPVSDGNTDINTVHIGTRGCNQNGAPISTLDTASYIINGHTTAVNGSTGFLQCNPASQPGPFPVVVEWNGLTTALTTAARSGLTPGQTYRIKLAVADVGDDRYDSGAIFELIEGTYDLDYGDAPTSGGYGNPYHEIRSNLRLGPTITPETGPYNNPSASGDVDDGISFPTLQAGSAATVTAEVVGAGGFLQGWVDWNSDGDFADSGEQVAANLQDTDNDGIITFSMTPPPAASGNFFARFRWSATAGLGPTAAALSGEVEDYQITVGSGPPPSLSCPTGYTPIVRNGNATSVITGAEFSANALGAILAPGATTNSSNSARVRAAFPTLTLRLADIVPAGASMTFSVARDVNAGNLAIDTSLDGSSWMQVATFSSPPNDRAQQVIVTVPTGSAEYVRFRRLAGDVWIDGVAYTRACALPPLTGSKNITVYDPLAQGLYALPGNDVIYAITVANTGVASTDNNSVVVIDRIPSEIVVFNGATPEFGGGVVGWSQTGTALTFNPATDLAWSNAVSPPASFSACTYTPAAGYDPAVRYLCLNPKGTMPAGDPDPEFTLRLRGRIR